MWDLQAIAFLLLILYMCVVSKLFKDSILLSPVENWHFILGLFVSLAIFKIFLLSLMFIGFIMMCSGMGFFFVYPAGILRVF